MSQASHYLELAQKLTAAADRASDPEIVAGYLELAGKWIRLAEAAGAGADDLPARDGLEHARAENRPTPQQRP